MIVSFVVSSLHLFIHISMYFSCFPIEYRDPKLHIRPFSAFSVPIFVRLILLLPAVTFSFSLCTFVVFLMPLFSAAPYCIRCFQSFPVPDAAAADDDDALAAAAAAAVAVAACWYAFAAALRVA